MQYEIFSRQNPFLRPLLSQLERAGDNRAPVPRDNAWWHAQEFLSDWIETSFNTYRDVRDHTAEAVFHAVYGSPLLQALVGLKASPGNPRQRPGEDAMHLAFVTKRIDELKQAIPQGGPREAMIRALLYVRMPEGVVDERGFNLLRRMRQETGGDLTLSEFKKLLREQFFMLTLDERRAVDAIPAMLAKDPDLASRLAGKLRRLIAVVGAQSAESTARLAEVERFFVRDREASEDANREISQPAPVRPAQARTAGSSKHR
jgi:hypothetical protein